MARAAAAVLDPPPAQVPHAAIAGVLKDIRIDLIDLGSNVRVDPGELEELAASIRELGVLQPVKAIDTGKGGFRLVWGQRRVLAAKLAGLELIPAIVFGPAIRAIDYPLGEPGAKRSIEQLVENLHRADLNPIDEARALREVLDADPKLTQEALADKLGRSRPWVSNAVRLLTLDESVQERVGSGEISATHARAIASLPEKQQRELARAASSSKMSSRQLEREIEWKQDSAANDERKVTKTAKWIPKAIAALEAAKVPKDALVAVRGSNYDMDVERIVRAIQKAGWKTASTSWLRDRPSKGNCDCAAVLLEVGGRKAEVKPACSDTRHQDREHEQRRKESAVAEREQREHLAAFGQAIADELAALPRVVLQVLFVKFRSASGWWGNWPEVEALDVDELLGAIRKDLSEPYGTHRINTEAALAALQSDTSGAHVLGPDVEQGLPIEIEGPDEREVRSLEARGMDLEAAELRTVVEGRLARGMCSVCGRDVALRKGGLVREHRAPGDGENDPVCSGSGVAAA